MAKRKVLCPEDPDGCGPIDTRGLLSHLANTHLDGDYEQAREIRDGADLVEVEDQPDGDPQTADEPTTEPQTEPEPSTEPDPDPDPQQSTGDDQLGAESADAFDGHGSAPEPRQDPEPSTVRTRDPEPQRSEPEPDPDPVTVKEEGEEKLKPANEQGRAQTVAPPQGAPENAPPEAYEPGPDRGERAERPERGDRPDRAEPDRDPDPGPEGSSGGALSGMFGGSDEPDEPRDPDRIVEDADTPEERDRRAEVRDRLDRAVGGEEIEEPADDAEAPDTEATGTNILIDKDLAKHLLGQPFETAATVTEWDGWRLSDEEKAANAELLAAMADKRGIQMSPELTLLINMSMIATGRLVGYRRYKAQNGGDGETAAEPETEPAGDLEPAEPETPTATAETGAPEAAADGGEGEDETEADRDDDPLYP